MKRLIEEKLGVNIKNRVFIAAISILALSCEYNDTPRPADCSKSSLAITRVEKIDESGCSLNNGIAQVFVEGGVPPYVYFINGQNEQSSNTFANLSAGFYSLLIRDSKGCSDTMTFEIANFVSTLRATTIVSADSKCEEGNGFVKVRPTGGVPPFTFAFEKQAPTKDSIFNNLNQGQYTLSVTDALQCKYSFGVTIPRATTGVSWSNQIKSIVDRSCAKAGCHVAGTGRVDLTTFENVKLHAGQIRARVISRSMPFDGKLPDDQIQLISCWVEDGAQEN